MLGLDKFPLKSISIFYIELAVISVQWIMCNCKPFGRDLVMTSFLPGVDSPAQWVVQCSLPETLANAADSVGAALPPTRKWKALPWLPLDLVGISAL